MKIMICKGNEVKLHFNGTTCSTFPSKHRNSVSVRKYCTRFSGRGRFGSDIRPQLKKHCALSPVLFLYYYSSLAPPTPYYFDFFTSNYFCTIANYYHLPRPVSMMVFIVLQSKTKGFVRKDNFL